MIGDEQGAQCAPRQASYGALRVSRAHVAAQFARRLEQRQKLLVPLGAGGRADLNDVVLAAGCGWMATAWGPNGSRQASFLVDR